MADGGASATGVSGPGNSTWVIREPNLLICEGQQERRFFEAVLKQAPRPVQVQCRDCGGKSALPRFLRMLAVVPGFDTLRWIGIVTDADTNAGSAFIRVRAALKASGLPEPAKAWQAQTGGDQTVAVFVLPDENTPGDLETVLWEHLQGQPIAQCILDFLSCASPEMVDSNHLPKARVAAWLATRERPDLRLGEAAEAGLCDFMWNIGQFRRLLELIP